MICGLFTGTTLTIRQRSETPFVHGRTETSNTRTQTVELDPGCLGRPIPKGLELALGMKAWSDNVLAEYSMFHFVFVHLAARTSISERLSSNFRTAGTNERLDFNLSLHTSCDSRNWPCKMWSGSRELRLARESVAP